MKRVLLPAGALTCWLLSPSQLHAQQTLKRDTVRVVRQDTTAEQKLEKNRNVMLNADNNTGPRQVNIGLPFNNDVLILENSVPIVFNFFPTIPTTTWRYDNSIARIGLLSFAEGALVFGKVGFVVDSYDREATSSIKGFGSVYTNSFGSLRYDATVTGPISKNGWGFTLSGYESFDRGSGTNYMFTPWQDRTQIFKGSIAKKYKSGSIRLLYKYSEARNVNINNGYFPYVYEGSGKFRAVDGFKPGSDSYIIRDGNAPYYDPITGVAGTENIGSDEAALSVMHNFYLTGNHNFAKGWKLTYSSMFQAANSSFDSEFPISIGAFGADQQAGQQFKYQASSQIYKGPVQLIAHVNFPHAYNRYSASRAEVTKKLSHNDVRFGLTYQFDATKYIQHNSTYYQTLEANPRLLDLYAFVPQLNGYVQATNQYGGLPGSAGGYGNVMDFTYSKLAFYASDDIKLGKRVEIALGGRIEHQDIHDVHNPYINQFILDRPLVTQDFKNQYNKVGLASAVVKLTARFGLLGDATYNSFSDRIWDYKYRDANGNPIGDPAIAGSKPLQDVGKSLETSVLNLGAGVYYNVGETFSLVSKITRIAKKNIYTQATLTNPANTNQRSTFDPLLYDIGTLGWSTDVVAKPFKGAAVHVLLTLQDPQFKNYEYGAFGVNYSYSNNAIPSLSKTLVEFDPSYSFNKGTMRAWLSVRYFGKQFGTPTNAIYYNGWFENFGGLDYRLSRSIEFKLQVTNFLDQRGVKGTLQGADQITNDTNFIGRYLVAGAIRPRTIEFTTNIKL